MTIQETIIEAFKASQSAHGRALTTIASLRTEKGALEAEVARLHSQIANLKSHIAHLETESLKIVEPSSVQSLLATLLQVVEETNQATSTTQAGAARNVVATRTEMMPPVDDSRNEEASALTVNHPMRVLQARRIVERNGSFPEALDVAQ